MGLTAFAIEQRIFAYFATLIVALTGIVAFFNLGQLEDPEFTIKAAVISTQYLGASPEEVELEVSDRIELAVQEMAEIKYVESLSRAGLSIIKIEIRPEFSSDEIPQIWDELRRKIRDIEGKLPPGAGRPDVSDDFGDVFGFQLALTSDGFGYAELEQYAKDLKKEISLVKGVARVDLWGAQPKVVYIDASKVQLAQFGISDQNLEATLKAQNLVVDAGSVDVESRRFRIAPTGSFQSPEEIGELLIRPTVLDIARGDTGQAGQPASQSLNELIRIKDIGTIRRGYLDPPVTQMRYNGMPAIGISITNQKGVNIVDVGSAIDARLAELVPHIPVGIGVHRVHWQSDIVAEAVNNFLISFAEALAIVLVVLGIFMGWRMAVIIGTSLIVTILGSFILMALFKIDLQRMSLGALVIALGMMVDNSIVVADGIAVRIREGMDRKQAAIEAASQPSMPLLGATIIAVMTFYPIVASTENAGEYCATLFSVVAISLMVSWVVSMTVTPLQTMDMLPAPKEGGKSKDPYDTGFFRTFRKYLELSIRARWATFGTMVALLALAVVSFGRVEKLFFPDSSMTKFMVDFWAPEGTRIEETKAAVARAEKKIMADPRVTGVASYIGAGPPRFYLPVEPEKPYSSYAQIVVNVKDYREITAITKELGGWIAEQFPESLVPIRPFGVGPAFTWKFDARIIGPGVSDPKTLRATANGVRKVLDDSNLSAYSRTDWRQQIPKVVPVYSQERGRWAGVTREDIARTTKRAYDGRRIGLYRESDDLIPIILRHVEEERQDPGGMDVLEVQPALSSKAIPLAQVTDDVALKWENPLIWRRDRRRTIKVQGNPVAGETLPTLWADVGKKIEAVKLPAGYKLEWGGEFESSRDSQQSLIPGVVPASVIILLIIVALFNAFRPLFVILLTIPFAFIGITFGLLGTGASFGFVALLGAMSLAGMMIKNAIVLLDQINVNLDAGMDRYESTIQAALSRLSPVSLAAATTVLGVIPLVQDPFWIGLAVTIMAGLSFGTVLTMILVPVLYATLHGVHAPAKVKR
ncbi:MAG: efflux RND transporter permease subunit [Hyphomicrobiales bacterium]|nr:efflux RND transporter permease subunit [Hyphomicrobiales bacterium]